MGDGVSKLEEENRHDEAVWEVTNQNKYEKHRHKEQKLQEQRLGEVERNRHQEQSWRHGIEKERLAITREQTELSKMKEKGNEKLKSLELKSKDELERLRIKKDIFLSIYKENTIRGVEAMHSGRDPPATFFDTKRELSTIGSIWQSQRRIQQGD